jgi:parallel beta-helix repeat protein
MRNLHIVDARSQMIKISYFQSSSSRSEDGLVEKCLIEYSAGIGVQYYTGGIDGHFCRNWIVRNNTIKGIKSPESELAEHAIHFWSSSEGTRVENNRIIDCDRGIGFGLGDRGHIGGIISGNYVNTTRDVGIGLENSSNTEVYNNTVYTEKYANSIEYRFPGTNNCTIRDNVTNGLIVSRDGGTAKLENNKTGDD